MPMGSWSAVVYSVLFHLSDANIFYFAAFVFLVSSLIRGAFKPPEAVHGVFQNSDL